LSPTWIVTSLNDGGATTEIELLDQSLVASSDVVFLTPTW